MVSIYNRRFRPKFICPYCIRAEFVCPYCGAKFSTREALRVHIYNSHIEKFDEFVDDLRNTSFTNPLMKENEDNCYESQSQQIYVDNDYLYALKIADKYLYAWMTRDGSMAYDLVSDNIKRKYKDKEDFKMDFAGVSNPHHECFEIVGCKCRSKDKIRFKVWMYYHYTGANEPPINRPENNACIELLKINEEKWLVDKVFSD